ncbi:hypothetical protein G1H11_02580 [Phytoactinopolyspora alkaliphila]|uniref:Class I SAM-dependent methyltransferase n=1 Tax=Phytoactinopolyspora alkaliphila TaxID=1783498 RepID=A0A6N9YH02_9ACTN|nr:hypothetical protein [Phytoactinopolyspora alkaliphila]NED94188.1 hypothetical protein [Phytoactinopolyspora alkaliphila]
MRTIRSRYTGNSRSWGCQDVTWDAHPDRVVAHMVLMDLPELGRLVADVRASLTRDGVVAFSILHPCFFAHAPIEGVALLPA